MRSYARVVFVFVLPLSPALANAEVTTRVDVGNFSTPLAGDRKTASFGPILSIASKSEQNAEHDGAWFAAGTAYAYSDIGWHGDVFAMRARLGNWGYWSGGPINGNVQPYYYTASTAEYHGYNLIELTEAKTVSFSSAFTFLAPNNFQLPVGFQVRLENANTGARVLTLQREFPDLPASLTLAPGRYVLSLNMGLGVSDNDPGREGLQGAQISDAWNYQFLMFTRSDRVPSIGLGAGNPHPSTVNASGTAMLSNIANLDYVAMPDAGQLRVHTTSEDSLIRSILIPQESTATFTVSVGDKFLGTYGPGQMLSFQNMLEGDVRELVLTRVDNTMDKSVALALPPLILSLGYSTATADLEIVVPEPAALSLLALGTVFGVVRKRRSGARAQRGG
jgi:hypothetical protein